MAYTNTDIVSNVRKVNATTTTVTITWNTVPDIGSFHIFRNGLFIGNCVGHTYTDFEVLPNTAYTYIVKAIINFPGKTSASIAITTPLSDVIVPPPPPPPLPLPANADFYGGFDNGIKNGTGNGNKTWANITTGDTANLTLVPVTNGYYGQFNIPSTQSNVEVFDMRSSAETNIYENNFIGDTVQYTLSVRAPTGHVQIPVTHANGLKFHILLRLQTGIAGQDPVIALDISGRPGFAELGYAIRHRAGNIATNLGSTYVLSEPTVRLDIWTHFKITVKYASDNTGSIKVERMDEDETVFITVLTLNNIPTLSYDPAVNGGVVGNHTMRMGIFWNDYAYNGRIELDNFTRVTLIHAPKEALFNVSATANTLTNTSNNHFADARATQTSYKDNNNSLKVVGANTLVVANGGIKHLPSNTYVQQYSNNFDNAVYSLTGLAAFGVGGSVTNAIIGPDGVTVNATLLKENTATSEHFIQQVLPNPASTGLTYTSSIFIKKSTTPTFAIQIVNIGTGSTAQSSFYVTIDATSGAVTYNLKTGLIATYTIEPYSNGWYRLAVTYTLNGTTTSFRIRYFPKATGSYLGTGADVYIYGGNTVQGSLDDYFPTTDSANLVRATDAISVPLNLGSNFSQSNYAILLKIQLPAASSAGVKNLITLSSGVNYLYIDTSGNICLSDGTNTAIAASAGWAANDVLYIYALHEASNLKMRVGVSKNNTTWVESAITTYDGALALGDSIQLAKDYPGIIYFNKIKSLITTYGFTEFVNAAKLDTIFSDIVTSNYIYVTSAPWNTPINGNAATTLAAINKCLLDVSTSNPGATVYIPPGTFNIDMTTTAVDPSANPNRITMRSGLTLRIDGTIVINKSATENYAIIYVNGCTNAKIIGNGLIVGDRDLHDPKATFTGSIAPTTYNGAAKGLLTISGLVGTIVPNYANTELYSASGGLQPNTKIETQLSSTQFIVSISQTVSSRAMKHFTGQHGFGIQVNNSTNTEILGASPNTPLRITKCWGDGIYLGGTNRANIGKVQYVDSYNNRRCGLSPIWANNWKIWDCTLRDTQGTLPGDGMDCEPNANQVVDTIDVQRCIITNNLGSGVDIYLAAGNRATTTNRNITVNNCTISGNGTAFAGVTINCRSAGGSNIDITNNTIIDNVKTGVFMIDSDGVTVTNNNISGNTSGSVGYGCYLLNQTLGNTNINITYNHITNGGGQTNHILVIGTNGPNVTTSPNTLD
jgi:parallel beta-helix repeat protein